MLICWEIIMRVETKKVSEVPLEFDPGFDSVKSCFPLCWLLLCFNITIFKVVVHCTFNELVYIVFKVVVHFTCNELIDIVFNKVVHCTCNELIYIDSGVVLWYVLNVKLFVVKSWNILAAYLLFQYHHRPHQCPEPRNKMYAPTNILKRMFHRQVFVTLSLYHRRP